MVLRESIDHAGEEFSVDSVRGDVADEAAIPHAAALNAFAEAVVGDDDAALDEARSVLIEAIGEAGFVDAAGVVASFNSVVRIADATGIPLEDFKREATEDVRAELGIDEWH